MVHTFERILFIFRRDLRLEDNHGFHAASLQAKEIVPVFFFDPRQVEEQNKYRSMHAIQFMMESLQDLEGQINKHKGLLYYFYGQPEKLLAPLFQQLKIDAVFFNKDYTPFARMRDQEIEAVCKKHDIVCKQFDDLLLGDPDKIKNKNGNSYAVFTYFYKAAKAISVSKPSCKMAYSFYTKLLPDKAAKQKMAKIVGFQDTSKPLIAGGTAAAKKLLQGLGHLKNYAVTRDFPAQQTSHLSAHLKFGTVSARQVYHAVVEVLDSDHPLLRQLYWRDFFTYTAYHKPIMFGACLRASFDTIAWSYDTKKFERWAKGMTGFPIIDAGMRELNATGFMHNRVRMLTASFLTKDLHIDWRWGERYFAQQLTDYDPAVNNGNWQWAASVGIDAQPYFRIFNPWLGQKKFDADCLYIKKWVPELEKYSSKIIHSWYTQEKLHGTCYIAPMVDHAVERINALARYKNVIKK